MTIETIHDTVADWRSPDDRTFRHTALLYRNNEEFLAGALPILRAGVEANDPTIAVFSGSEATLLRDALGQDASAVQFIDPGPVYQNPVRAIAAFSALAKSLGQRPAWVIAGTGWLGSPDVMEWVRYESLSNILFADVNYRGVCCYDEALFPPEFVAWAKETHPKVLRGDRVLDDQHYVDPAAFVAGLDQLPQPLVPQEVESLQIEPTDLPTVRSFVAERAQHHGVRAGVLHSLLVAVTEVATNAIRYGSAPIMLRVWRGDHGLVCEITDSGSWQPNELITWTPPESALDAGFGLWGVRMLCDTMQIRTGSNGTAVRLLVFL